MNFIRASNVHAGLVARETRQLVSNYPDKSVYVIPSETRVFKKNVATKLNRRKLRIFKFNPTSYRLKGTEFQKVGTLSRVLLFHEAAIQLKVYIFSRDDWSMDRKRQMDRESNEIAMEMKFFRSTDIVLDRV